MFSKGSDNKNVRKKPTRRKVSDKKKTLAHEQASASFSPRAGKHAAPGNAYPEDASFQDSDFDGACNDAAQGGFAPADDYAAADVGQAQADYFYDGYTDDGSADAYADGNYAADDYAGDDHADGYPADSQASDGAASPDQDGEEPWIPEDMGLFDENGDFVEQESEYAIPPRTWSHRDGAQDDRQAKPPRKPVNKKLVALVSIIAAVALVVGGFIFLRWHLHDDAQLIQGEWKIAAADRTVVFTDDTIKVTKKVSYDYEMNVDDKIITYRFANMAESAPNNYYFSLDGQTLVITEGDAPNILVQIGLLPNPAITADNIDDRVTVLIKVSNDTKAKPGKYKGPLSESSDKSSSSSTSSKDGADKAGSSSSSDKSDSKSSDSASSKSSSSTSQG